MIARFLVLLLAAAFPALAGQRGFCGPVSNHPKAGAPASDITFTNILNPPGVASWHPSNLVGQLTVLGLF